MNKVTTCAKPVKLLTEEEMLEAISLFESILFERENPYWRFTYGIKKAPHNLFIVNLGIL